MEPSAIQAPDVLVVSLGDGYNWVAKECGTPEARAKIEQALQHMLHRPLTLRFAMAEEEDGAATSSAPAAPAAPSGRALLEEDPMVQKVVELFEARPVHLEVEEDASRPSRS